MGHKRGSWETVIAAGGAAVLGLLATQTGVAQQAPVSIGEPITLASGFQADLGVGPSAVGSDETVWLAQPVGGGRFRIIGRAASGRTMRPVLVSGGIGSVTSTPAITVSATTATLVWETAPNGVDGSSGTVYVRARRCTLGGCTPTQTLSSWHWTYANNSFPAMGYWAKPAVATAGGRAVVVFYRDSGSDPQMMWAQTDGVRFGALHALGGGGWADPVAVGESGGRVLAAWFDNVSSSVDWAQWSLAAGFTRSQSFSDGQGFYSADLVAAPLGAGAAIAWIQGDNTTDPGLDADPVWVARTQASSFTKPVRVFADDAFGLTLDGGRGVLALAFTTTTPGLDAGAPGPAIVETSIDGAPFGSPVDLDDTAAPYPAVSVGSGASVLATWNANSTAQIAIAPAAGKFDPPVTLGPETRNDSPTIHTDGAQSLLVWQNPSGAVRGVLTTP